MRKIGTVVRGIRMPVFNRGDDLVSLITKNLSEAIDEENIHVSDMDIIAITESIVARTENNYVSLEDVAKEVRNKLGKGPIGLLFPILSRNRFGSILKAISMGVDELIIQLSYPKDEVGNPLMDERELESLGINPSVDEFSLDEFKSIFKQSFKHPFTEVDYIEYYESINKNIKIIFSNKIESILKYTHKVICADIHTREETRRKVLKLGAHTAITLGDLMNEVNLNHGYNTKYGLLGSNYAGKDQLKLFPEHGEKIVLGIQNFFRNQYHKHVEVMIYGDGAFKDPVAKIWELADPVVSPFYTKGLEGMPHELKFKLIADDLNIKEIEDMKTYIKNHKNEQSNQLGTTPRRLTDLLGSLCDLTSGSGDKGTPVVYIQNYFDNYSKE